MPDEASSFHHSYTCIDAMLVPETTCKYLRTISAIIPVIVYVIGWEHHPIVVAHRVSSVAGILGNSKRVVSGFACDKKSAIIGHVYHAIRSCLDETPEFVASFIGQLMQQVIAEPVVASRVVESDFKLRPRTIEEVGSVKIHWISNGMQLAAQIDNTNCSLTALLDLVSSQSAR